MILTDATKTADLSWLGKLKYAILAWVLSFYGDEPLIYTSKGNLPERMLDFSWRWEATPTQITYIETHRLNGEIVKDKPAIILIQTEALGIKPGKLS